MADAKPIKVLAIGAVNGRIEALLKKVTAINSKHGPFELLLCVGDFFGAGAPGDATAAALLTGKIQVPISTYIISGKNALPARVQGAVEDNGGEICDNLMYLGESGIMTTAEGLKIAYLSGTHDSHQSYHRATDAPEVADAPYHYTSATIRSLSKLPPTPPQVPIGVDILLTSEWPEGITYLSSALPKGSTSVPDEEHQDAVRPVAELAAGVQPRYHFASGTSFWEREPYGNNQGAAHVTRFVGLAEFGLGKERWHYAFNIVPLTKIDVKQLVARPNNTTKCPLLVGFGGAGMKRGATEDMDTFFFEKGPKRQATNTGRPPKTYVCHRCQQPGHWIADCPTAQAAPPAHYVCRICNVPGHYIKDCPNADHSLSSKADPVLNRDNSQCWFCLSNPALEKHLIVAIGSEVYLTLAKGGLVDWGGHMLIVPIGHYPSTRQMQMLTGEEATTAQSALAEIAQIKSRIAAVYEERKEVMVCFEVFGGGAGVVDGNRLQHMHVQVVPVPAELRSKIEEVFEEECRREDLEAVEEEQPSDDAVTPYCRVEFPGDDGKTRVLVFSPSAAKMDAWRQGCAEAAETGRRPPRLFNLQFGRVVLSTLLGDPQRSNWKHCVLPEDEEKKLTEEMRQLVKL